VSAESIDISIAPIKLDHHSFFIAVIRDISLRGDLLLLSEGDRVAADARLLVANAMMVDESLLTGESEPVEKRARGGDAGAQGKVSRSSGSSTPGAKRPGPVSFGSSDLRVLREERNRDSIRHQSARSPIARFSPARSRMRMNFC
jgi:hypothetical protein